MDPYSILGVPRGCTREQVKEAYRSLVHRAHPDRGGDGEAFVRLCAAYREIMNQWERDEIPPGAGPVMAPPGDVAPRPPDPRSAREGYVAWLRQVSEESARRRSVPWWRRRPELARAWLLGLIGLGGVLVLCAAMALGGRSPRHPAGPGMGAARGLEPATGPHRGRSR